MGNDMKLTWHIAWMLLVMLTVIVGCQPALPYDYMATPPLFGLSGFATEHYFFHSQMSDETTYDLAWLTPSRFWYQVL